MTAPVQQDMLNHPYAHGELPGPRSAELLAMQGRGVFTHGLDFPSPGPGWTVDSRREIFPAVRRDNPVVRRDNPRNLRGRSPSQSGCVPHRSASPPAAYLGPEGLPYQRFSALSSHDKHGAAACLP